MTSTYTATLSKNPNPQSASIPGWLGVLDLGGSRYLVQGWVSVKSPYKAELFLDLSRRMSGIRLTSTAILQVHPDKRSPDQPDLRGSVSLADREWTARAWMKRDDTGKKVFELFFVERDEDELHSTEARPVLRPRPRASVRFPHRPGPM